MTERLKELQRQRALVQEHLAWLDREIVREAGAPATARPAAASVAPVESPAAAPHASAAAARAEAEAEAMMAEYRRDPESLQSSVKRGCLLYFLGAFALLALGLVAWYFLRQGR